MAMKLIEADDAARAVCAGQRAEIRVEVAGDGGDLALYCDEAALNEALRLLLDGALPMTSDRPATLTIEAEGMYVRFSIQSVAVAQQLHDLAQAIGGSAWVDGATVALLAPSAGWSPSHGH
jgi:hypothetical protein